MWVSVLEFDTRLHSRIPSAVRRLTHAYTPPMRFGKVTSVVHPSERSQACPGCAERHEGVQVGVWMARIERRSNASPEPRSAM